MTFEGRFCKTQGNKCKLNTDYTIEVTRLLQEGAYNSYSAFS